MIKTYTKIAPIQAEQFDASEEMIRRYRIEDASSSAPQFDGTQVVAHTYYLSTLEGKLIVWPGDWIATGVDGEHWSIADDIFRRTYKEVTHAL